MSARLLDRWEFCYWFLTVAFDWCAVKVEDAALWDDLDRPIEWNACVALPFIIPHSFFVSALFAEELLEVMPPVASGRFIRAFFFPIFQGANI